MLRHKSDFPYGYCCVYTKYVPTRYLEDPITVTAKAIWQAAQEAASSDELARLRGDQAKGAESFLKVYLELGTKNPMLDFWRMVVFIKQRHSKKFKACRDLKRIGVVAPEEVGEDDFLKGASIAEAAVRRVHPYR